MIRQSVTLTEDGVRLLVMLCRYVRAHGSTSRAAQQAAAIFRRACGDDAKSAVCHGASFGITFDGKLNTREALAEELRAWLKPEPEASPRSQRSQSQSEKPKDTIPQAEGPTSR